MKRTEVETQTGTILHLQRLSTEDGPGIRTTVFFKGCPLECRWCHNPESVSIKPQVQWLSVHCIGCHDCIDICPQHGLTLVVAGIHRNKAVCTVCGTCVDQCPANAMEKLGRVVTVNELADELTKDRAYFEKSGGGVTLSGGEPTLQPVFTLELLKALKERGLQTALDTCGLCSRQVLTSLLPRVDILLFDLKIMDPIRHKEWTGSVNDRILDNLVWVSSQIGELYPELRLWVRTPLIPGATDQKENISAIAQFLDQNVGDMLERWELCAFNNLGRDKYARLGMEWQFAEQPLMTRSQLDEALLIAREHYRFPEKVFVTGSARLEND